METNNETEALYSIQLSRIRTQKKKKNINENRTYWSLLTENLQN